MRWETSPRLRWYPTFLDTIWRTWFALCCGDLSLRWRTCQSNNQYQHGPKQDAYERDPSHIVSSTPSQSCLFELSPNPGADHIISLMGGLTEGSLHRCMRHHQTYGM